jgi:curli biogenesis system outer membrane secretion channel CsgG
MVFWALGCGEDSKGTIQIVYERQAQRDVPQRIHQLAVNEFSGDNKSSDKWGQVASDKLLAVLEQSNRKANRFVLVDRMGLKKILDERDLQTAFSDPEKAASHAGKLKEVDAIIYGDVMASHEKVLASKMKLDIASQSMKNVSYYKLCCQVIVKFTMVDVTNGSTLATLSTTENYDSDKDSKLSKFAKILGQESAESYHEVMGVLVDKAVEKFVAYISPHEDSVNVRLANVKSQAARRGNALARNCDYDGALKEYVAGMQEQPDDDGAVFNAGLMCEAKHDMVNAAKYYERAFHARDDVRYAESLARVRNNKD